MYFLQEVDRLSPATELNDIDDVVCFVTLVLWVTVWSSNQNAFGAASSSKESFDIRFLPMKPSDSACVLSFLFFGSSVFFNRTYLVFQLPLLHQRILCRYHRLLQAPSIFQS